MTFYFLHLIHHTTSGWTTERVSAAILEIVSPCFSTEVSFGSVVFCGYGRRTRCSIGCSTWCGTECSNGWKSFDNADFGLGAVPGVVIALIAGLDGM